MTEIILYIILIQIIYFLWFHFVLSYKKDKQDKSIKDSLNKFLMFMAPIYIIIIWNMYNMNLNRGKICDYMPILNKLCSL